MLLRSHVHALKNASPRSMLSISKDYDFKYNLYFCGELLLASPLRFD